MMNDERERESSFLNRWSDRKTAVRDGHARDLGDIPEQAGVELPKVREQISDENAVVPDDLPDINTMDKDSDFTLFMREGTPEHLKRLALKKLFHSDPAFAVLDGLNDYDEDYSMIGIVAEAVSTRYQPGKGMFDPDEKKPDELEPKGDSTEDVGEAEVFDKEKLEETPSDLREAGEKDNDALGGSLGHKDQKIETVGPTKIEDGAIK
jgi:hypothetical protein